MAFCQQQLSRVSPQACGQDQRCRSSASELRLLEKDGNVLARGVAGGQKRTVSRRALCLCLCVSPCLSLALNLSLHFPLSPENKSKTRSVGSRGRSVQRVQTVWRVRVRRGTWAGGCFPWRIFFLFAAKDGEFSFFESDRPRPGLGSGLGSRRLAWEPLPPLLRHQPRARILRARIHPSKC